MCNGNGLNQALWQDGATARIAGTLPRALAFPNGYTQAGIPQNQSTPLVLGSRLLGTTSATLISIVAATWSPIITNGISGTIWIDGVVSNHNFALGQPDSFPLRWDIALDGNPHTIEIEEQAGIINVIGNIVWTARYQPKYRVIVVGDSIVTGQGAAFPSGGWAYQLRHSLTSGTAGYGVTILGQSGSVLTGSPPFASALAALCDATTRNVVVIALMINDYLNSGNVALFSSTLDAYVTAIQAACPAGTRIVLNTSPQTANAGIGPGTLAQYRAVFTAKANGSTILAVDNSALYTGGTPWVADTADGVHPNDTGHALIAAAVKTVVQTAATN